MEERTIKINKVVSIEIVYFWRIVIQDLQVL